MSTTRTAPTSPSSGDKTSPPTFARVLRKAAVLKKLSLSKSTLHAKLDPRSRYYDPSIPRPRYLPGSRIPFWSEQEVDAWLAKIFGTDTNAERA